MLKWYLWVALLLGGLLLARPAAAYSVLTHQAQIDSSWTPCLLPLLQQRYPGASDDQLLEAKSYAYGGSILQDMGYYPLGSEFFTNLTHYVRSGDFVRHLLAEAHSRNEYAFALGALAHYTADLTGHPEGTNRAMPEVYPDLKAKFGSPITYEQAPAQHTQLEFAFDVVQVASGRYRSSDYQRYIGFQVSKPLMERAFLKTYGLELGQVVFNVDLAIGSFRFAVRNLIPLASRAAWQTQKKKIRELSPRARRREYVYKESSHDYKKRYGNTYEHPGFGARMLSYFVRVMPKIGPLKPFAFTVPTPAAEQLFRASFRQALKDYCGLLRQQPHDTLAAVPPLPNRDFDTGKATHADEYALTDKTYGEWLHKLEDRKFEHLTANQKHNLLTFFQHPETVAVGVGEDNDGDMSEALEKDEEAQERARLLRALEALRAAVPADSAGH